MIDPASYNKEWLDSLKAANKSIDPSLCEKMIRALGLLEELAANNLNFVFKGGTYLILFDFFVNAVNMVNSVYNVH